VTIAKSTAKALAISVASAVIAAAINIGGFVLSPRFVRVLGEFRRVFVAGEARRVFVQDPAREVFVPSENRTVVIPSDDSEGI